MNKSISHIDKIGWHFDNTYSRLPKAMSSQLNPIPVKDPKLTIFNHGFSKELGLDFSSLNNNQIASIFSGNLLPKESKCIAQAYAGHQFGYFTMLGDGRAILIGEHLSKNNKRFDIQFKGSGKTPYSRNGDGRAALGPMLREYIISEAMYGLGIPTTRSLAVVKTGENVIRETPLPGAILTRVAASHIRVGTFQYVTATEDEKNLKTLFDYTIDRHYPKIKDSKTPAIDLLKIVMEKQIKLVVDWMRVGFIHGVMNTDNMAISGETIDYGPCAFMDSYDAGTVFSSIDTQGRYSFANQPSIIHWNLVRLAESLLPLIDKNEKKSIEIAQNTLNEFSALFKNEWLQMMRKKIGIEDRSEEDEELISNLVNWMQNKSPDFTNTFCNLMNYNHANDEVFGDNDFGTWKKNWQERVKNKEYLKTMINTNPVLIPRNYLVEEALNEAETKGKLNKFNDLNKAISSPYHIEKVNIKYLITPSKTNIPYKTFCGT